MKTCEDEFVFKFSLERHEWNSSKLDSCLDKMWSQIFLNFFFTAYQPSEG